MKAIRNIRQDICIYILLCTSATLMGTVPLGPDDAYTWSISNDQLDISSGSVITNAVLTIHDVSIDDTMDNAALYVHLLDNPDVDIKSYTDGQTGNYFEDYGVFLKQIGQDDLSANPSDIIIDLAQVNDDNSPVWTVFEQPFIVTLGDASQVSFSSALLSLLDYAGTGWSFGFGLDCDGVTFDGLTLELTIESMTDVVSASTLSFNYGNISSPVLEPITDQIIDPGQVLSFTITATDSDNDVLSYSASNLPEGAVFANQTFTWTPTNQQAGTYQVIFMVSDGNKITSQMVTITVNYIVTNDAPKFEPIPDKVATVDNTLTFTVIANDSDGDAVKISIENLPQNASFIDNVFSWTPSLSQVGIYDIIFNVTDGNGGQDSTITQITVSPAVAEWTLLTYDDFESGWGNFADGGSDCYLYTRYKYAPEGNNAADIQNGTEESQVVLANGLDVLTPGYSQIKITFSYLPVSMDNASEGFSLEYWDGTEWITLQSWYRYYDFQNFYTYFEIVEFSKENFAFPADMKIRFMCQASDDYDDVMIDEISIFAK